MRLQHKGLSCYVKCENEELQPYGVEIKGDIISCWIVSEAGKAFSLHWEDPSACTDMEVDVYMDGIPMDAWIHRKEWKEGRAGGVAETPISERPFQFANLNLTDDDSVAWHKATHDDLGVIQIICTRVQGFRESTFEDDFEVTTIGAVHEKSKKIGAHCISLRPSETVPLITRYDPVGPESKPFVTFEFRYRPLDILQADGVVPRPERKRKADSLDESGSESDGEDHANFIREQIVLLRNQLKRVRTDERKKKRVKREVSPIVIPDDAPSDEVIEISSDED